MTTLAANVARPFELGTIQEYPVIATDIIYEGAAVGVVKGTGYARPLVAGDEFVGFAESKSDNATGAAAAKTVRTRRSGQTQISVTGVTITDVNQPVYATDDAAFTMSPISSTFIGFVSRFVSSGVAVVAFDVKNYRDPYGDYGNREVISANKTLDIEDNGKLFWVDTDAVVITMPAVATPVNCTIVNGGSYGTILVAISPNASDKVQGPDLPGTDNKDLLNTKATAQRGDYAELITGDANGPVVRRLKGVWATEG